MSVYVSKIMIFPIKSLDPVYVSSARINKKGGLEYDRYIALFDEKGNILSRKREKKLYLIRSIYDMEYLTVTLKCGGKVNTFNLNDTKGIGEFISEFLEYRVEAKKGFFPDSIDTPGPTIIGRATLNEISSWFGINIDEMRLRLRTNIEIETEVPFWEDRLCDKEKGVYFYIGNVLFKGVNISKRCNIPPSDPLTGERIEDFERIFVEKRKKTLPQWAKDECFKGFYRVAINTIVPETEEGKKISVGDSLRIKEN